jgi:hypothetical protein
MDVDEFGTETVIVHSIYNPDLIIITRWIVLIINMGPVRRLATGWTGQNLFSLIVHTGSGAHLTSYPVGTGGFFPQE